MIERTDIAWAAGFLDGEAWFGLKDSSVASGSRYRRPCIEAAQNRPEPLEKLVAMFGGKVKPHVRSHIWTVEGAVRVIHVVEAVLPYLVGKHEDAARLLEYARTIPARPPREPFPKLPD